jgi:RNA polymerase sigma factor (sigma-70 family)
MIFWKKWQTKSAIEEQIQQNLPMLERIVASYESRHALQQELLQDIVVAIWQAERQFKGNANIKTYMARIAQNRCITHVDKSTREPKGAEVDEADAVSPCFGKSLEKEQQWQQLMHYVRLLPIQQKQTLSLMLEGFSYKDIASICGISESNVGVLINRGKTTLNQQLNGKQL